MAPKPPKFYAVKVGRDAPKIFRTWAETDQAVRNYPRAKHKSFLTQLEAQRWLEQDGPSNQPAASATKTAKRCHELIDITSDDNTDSSTHAPAKRQAINQSSSHTHSTEFDSNPPSYSTCPAASSSTGSNSHQLKVQQNSKVANRIQVPEEADKSDFLSKFSADQARVYEAVLSGQSVFFTGSAGTGKSFLLKHIIRHLRKDLQRTVYVTASTGIAASLIKGTTLHSFAGVGLGKESSEVLVVKIRRSKKSLKRWTSADVLVVDEISMIDGNLFDKLNFIAQSVRNCSQPFGGIQLILAGDFFQLPPVSPFGSGSARVPYVFESRCWAKCVPRMIVLREVFRQSNDLFVGILNELRLGVVTARTIQVMKALDREVHYQDGIAPTELYPCKNDVEHANAAHLASIKCEPQEFQSQDSSPVNYLTRAEVVAQLDKNLLVGSHLVLKRGAQVMLVKNMPDHRLVNGSVGVVESFEPFSSPDVPESSVPRHKELKKWPRVKFTNGTTITLAPLDFELEDASGVLVARRVQVPLILAWALSIHKSQGQTLDRVKINLERSFEKGQVYVALSRATSLDSIQVLGFTPSKVEAHPVVLEWAKNQDYVKREV